MIEVEVTYASIEKALLQKVSVPETFTIQEIIECSGILDCFPEIDLKQMKVGVFSKIKKLTDHVTTGDRIEIYRPLRIDPKIARRQRAASI